MNTSQQIALTAAEKCWDIQEEEGLSTAIAIILQACEEAVKEQHDCESCGGHYHGPKEDFLCHRCGKHICPTCCTVFNHWGEGEHGIGEPGERLAASAKDREALVQIKVEAKMVLKGIKYRVREIRSTVENGKGDPTGGLRSLDELVQSALAEEGKSDV